MRKQERQTQRPEWDGWLDLAVSQLRWKQAAPHIRKELEAHLEDAAGAYTKAGQNPEQAEKSALREMGDAVEVGLALDGVHRPKGQWGIMGLASFLMLGGAAVRSLLAGSGPGMVVMALAGVLGLGLLWWVYLVDYTFFGRHALGFWSFVLSVQLLAGPCASMMAQVISEGTTFSRFDICENILFFSGVGQAALLYYFVVYSTKRKHKNRWLLLYMLPVYSVMGVSFREPGRMPVTGWIFIALSMLVPVVMVKKGSLGFREKDIKIASAVGMGLSALILAFPTVKAALLWMESGKRNQLQAVLMGCRSWGSGEMAAGVPDGFRSQGELAALVAASLVGVVPVCLVLLAMLGGLAWCLRRAWKLPNRFGRFIATAVSAGFILQILLHMLNCFVLHGLFSVWLPFVSPSFTVQLANGFALGMMVSIFRMGNVVQSPVPVPERI